MTRIYWLFFFLILVSCSAKDKQENTESGTEKNYSYVTSIGKTNHILVFSDDDLWEGGLNKTVQYQLDKAFILPMDEMAFNVRQVSKENFNSELQKNRSIILIASMDDPSPSTEYIKNLLGEKQLNEIASDGFKILRVRNKWAQPQFLTFIVADDYNTLINQFKAEGKKIARQIRNNEIEAKKRSVSAARQNPGAVNAVKNKFGIDIKIPVEYKSVIDDKPNFVWIRKELGLSGVANLVLYSKPYEDQAEFKTANIIARRNRVMGKFIEGDLQDTPIITDTIIDPIFRVRPFDGNYAVEVSGLWRLKGDYMGGPFVHYVIHDKEKNRIISAEGFVYSTELNKMKYLMELLAIIHTMEI